MNSFVVEEVEELTEAQERAKYELDVVEELTADELMRENNALVQVSREEEIWRKMVFIFI